MCGHVGHLGKIPYDFSYAVKVAGEMICALHILRVLCAVAVAEGVETLLSNNKVWSELSC